MANLQTEIGTRSLITSVATDSNRKYFIRRSLDRKIGSSAVRRLSNSRVKAAIGCHRMSTSASTGASKRDGNSHGKVIVMANSEAECTEEERKRKSPYTLLVVAVALIDTRGRVMLAERPLEKHLQGLYEFPGGKVEAWESPERALVRELEEELGIRVKAEDLVPITFASHAYQDKGFHLLMPIYGCKWEGEEISLGAENQRLVWCYADELDGFDMPPADYPLLPAIKRFMDQYRRT